MSGYFSAGYFPGAATPSWYTAPDNAGINFIEKWILNKLVTVDNGDGTKTVKLYDDAGTEPPLKTWIYTIATETRSKAT